VDVGSLTPGDFEVTAKYFGKRLLGLAEDLVSDAQKFTVTP
jgi:hypothetical protein